MLRKEISNQLRIVSDIGSLPKKSIDESSVLNALCHLKGKSIALHCHPANLVKYVIQLDGIADSVLLVPYDACENFSRSIEEKLDLDLVLTDGIVNTEHWKVDVIAHHELLGSLEDNPRVSVTEDHTRWLLATSGTTGTPKIVSHTIESLTRTTTKGTVGRNLSWGLLYDPARFAGFQVVLQAILGNTELIVPSPDLGFESKIEYLAANRCSALSATPSLWRKVLMAKASQRLCLTQITLGGEIADQRIINSLAKQFPNATITHIFASTEAGVGFSVKDMKAGFPTSWVESGVRGVELKISDQGTLCLKNTHVNQAYLGGGGSIADHVGWIDTGDLVEIERDRVIFKGRLNGAINIGGNKVIPEDIESEILEVPGVFQVAVRAKASSIAGSLVEALVVPDPELKDASTLVKNIKQHCKKVLPSFKVPAFVRLVDELPMGTAGKIKR
jgi:acyl-CoA synthetase (AMP-forming)/AMP-acid ligase II